MNIQEREHLKKLLSNSEYLDNIVKQFNDRYDYYSYLKLLKSNLDAATPLDDDIAKELVQISITSNFSVEEILEIYQFLDDYYYKNMTTKYDDYSDPDSSDLANNDTRVFEGIQKLLGYFESIVLDHYNIN